jgi:hypothetical protein
MSPILRHDTCSGELRELTPRPGGRLGICACATSAGDVALLHAVFDEQ